MKLRDAAVRRAGDIYPVFRELFRKQRRDCGMTWQTTSR